MTEVGNHLFLVSIRVVLPADLDPNRRQDMMDAERTRGAELVRAGTIQAIWRVPGTTNNVGLWRAASATALHVALSSLPLFHYMDIDVTALADHPLAPVLAEVQS
jgi:muconolactone D-isomerase